MEPDKSQAKTVEAQLEVLRFLNENTDDYLFLLDLQANRLYLPQTFWSKYPLKKRGENYCTLEDWCDLVYAKDRPALEANLELLRQGKALEHDMEYRLMDREGNRVWISCRGHCQVDQQGLPSIMIGQISDTILERTGDPLTGAFNSSKLQDDIKEIRASGQDCFLLLLGVDNLKNINIRHGREYGNLLLRSIADTLEEYVGPGLRIYRLNGDCFAVNLPASDQSEIQQFYDRLRERLSQFCTVSAGVVAYQNHRNEDPSSLYQYAEEALDKAKRMGKDTLAFFSQKDYEEKLSTIELQEEFRQSIQQGFQGFFLCYQPQLYSRSYDIFGAEALLRFSSPTRGIVSPSDFIPVLEQTGMICSVGLWVLKTALEQCRIWRESLPDLHMSVNISYVQLDQENITQQVLDVVEHSGLSGDALTLEVTESMQLQDYSRFNRMFYRWKAAGIEISVDDFGTGYSSLGYLKSLEIDEIKIDRCFVSGIQHSAYNYHLLSNMVELARSSQIRVCCEGVETQDELTVLERLHPNLLQGFLFDRPYTTEEFEKHFIRMTSPEYSSRLLLQQKLRSFHWSQGQVSPQDMFSTPETLKTILDAMDEVIYVSDRVTYGLYYLNPAGRRLTGVYDYQGQKCYKVLQGKDDPCEFCTNSCLKKDSFYIWERDNKMWNRHFILKDKLIPWRGKMARLEIALDTTEQEVVSQKVRETLDFAQNVLGCAQVLASESDMERATMQTLKLVGEFYQADRSYIFEPDPVDKDSWNNTYEWCQEGVSSQQDSLQSIPTSLIQRWLKLFDEKKPVIISNMDDLKETEPEEWEVLQRQGIRRLIASPIFQDGEVCSFLGVDNPRHCLEDDALIQTLSLFLTNRFRRNETEERLGELLNLHYRDVLKNTDLGLWFIRISSDGSRKEMFSDETMRRVLGLDHKLSPTECYDYWYGRINEQYYPYVEQVMASMLHSGHVLQLEYPWKHPTRGEVMVRCTGIRTADSGDMICLEGYHRMISDVERPQFLPDSPSGERFEYNRKNGTIRFQTTRQLLAGDALQEEGFPQSWVESKLVHPHFAQQFQALFQDISHSKAIELLLRSKSGGYRWFKLRVYCPQCDQWDQDTLLVLLDAPDRERALELENMRIRDFYQASLSETIAYAEVDLESTQIRAAGGLWAGYEKKAPKEGESILQFMLQQADGLLRSSTLSSIDSLFNAWKELLSTAPNTHRIRYQRALNGQWHWVDLVVHTFREHSTGNLYALFYLKDIDIPMRQELAHRDAAQRDPLTNVYNRKAFQYEMESYMASPNEEHQGILLLLDIDNFKLINDQFGHLAGDKALQRVTSLLKSVFRSEDLVGRLGGDEFMVFLKGTVCRSVLEQRVQEFFSALRQNVTLPITCSVGAAFVKGYGFSYEESLRQADEALYQSKQTGKNHCSCYTAYLPAPPQKD